MDLSDEILSNLQSSTRLRNQVSSAKNKACGGKPASTADVSVGSLVYIKDDLSKLKGRERYIVVKKEGLECTLKKLLKTDLRNKEYILKTTEVFPVVSNVLHNESYLRGWEDVEDEEEENENVTFVNQDVAPVRSDIVPEVRDEGYENGGPFDYANAPINDPSVNVPPVGITEPFDTYDHDVDVQLHESSTNGIREEVTPAVVEAPSRRGGRTLSRPVWWKDYHTS